MLGLCSASALLQTLHRFRSRHDGAAPWITRIPHPHGMICEFLCVPFFQLFYHHNQFDDHLPFPHLWILLLPDIHHIRFLQLPSFSWCLNSNPHWMVPGLCTTNLAGMFLYSHHLVLPHNCPPACVSAWYDCLGASLHVLHFYGSYVTLEWSIFGLCAVTSQPGSSGCAGFCSFLALSPWQWVPPPPSKKPANTSLSSHLSLVQLISLRLLKLETNENVHFHTFFIFLPSPTVQLLAIIECKHNLDTTDTLALL